MQTKIIGGQPKSLARIHDNQNLASLPSKLRMEILELAETKPNFATTKRYANFRKDYSDWQADEIVQRIRLLLSDSRGCETEILAAFDELESRN